jgi:hypothetical protein
MTCIGKQLHVSNNSSADFGKRFGNTVSQDRLDEATEQLDSMILSRTLPSGGFQGRGSSSLVDFNYLGDNESLNLQPTISDGSNSKNKIFHTFKPKDLNREPYTYRQDEIIGTKGGSYPFDRRPLSASAETRAVNANHLQQQRIDALNQINAGYLAPKFRPIGNAKNAEHWKKDKKGSAFHAFHTATGAMYLEKLHPSLKLFDPDSDASSKKSGRSNKSSLKLANRMAKSSDDLEENVERDMHGAVFDMTATNEAEPDEFSSTFRDTGSAGNKNSSDFYGDLAVSGGDEMSNLALQIPAAQQLLTINVKQPKAAFGTVRPEWNSTHYCYSKFDNEHNNNKNMHLFSDFKRKRDEEHIRHILEKKLEAGHGLPLQSQQLDCLQAAAVDCSQTSTVWLPIASSSVDVPSTSLVHLSLSNTIFDPNSATRKSLSKSKKDIWALNMERLHNSSVIENNKSLQALYLDNEMNQHCEESHLFEDFHHKTEYQEMIGSNDPLYVIYREDCVLNRLKVSMPSCAAEDVNNIRAKLGQTGVGSNQHQGVRSSELRNFAAFHTVSPEMWVTARVCYLLLVCYYLVIVKPEKELEEEAQRRGSSNDLIDAVGHKKQSRMSVIKDLKGALSVGKTGLAHQSLSASKPSNTRMLSSHEELVSPVLKQKDGRNDKNYRAGIKSVESVSINGSSSRPEARIKRVPEKDTKSTHNRIAPTTAAPSVLPGSVATAGSASSPRHGSCLNDEEYILSLARKVELNDFWAVLEEQLSHLFPASSCGTFSTSGALCSVTMNVLTEFSWPNLQRLLDLHAHSALVCNIIEYGSDMLLRANDEEEADVGTGKESPKGSTNPANSMSSMLYGNQINPVPSNQQGISHQSVAEHGSVLSKPAAGNGGGKQDTKSGGDDAAAVNRFYAQFPQALLPILRKAVHRKVFHPAQLERKSPVSAKLCSWARRVCAGIYKYKAKESTLNISVNVNAVMPAFGTKTGDLSDNSSAVGSRQQLPPILSSTASAQFSNPRKRGQLSLTTALATTGSTTVPSSSTDMLSLVNYTAAGRAVTADGKAATLTVVSVGFDIFACYHTHRSPHQGHHHASSPIATGTLSLHEQFVLDDVLIVGMILSRPYDRLDVIIPSPPESLIQQHLKIVQLQNKSTLQGQAVSSAQFTAHQLAELQHKHVEDDSNWQYFENLTHFCKAHIEVEANSPSHRILPAAIAFDVDVAVDEIIEDGVDSAQYNTPHNHNIVSLGMQTQASFTGSDSSAAVDSQIHVNATTTDVAGAVSVGKFTAPNKHHSVTVSLTRLQAMNNRLNINSNNGVTGSSVSGLLNPQTHTDPPGTSSHSGGTHMSSHVNVPNINHVAANGSSRKYSRADIISKLNTFNKLTEHRSHLQTYGDRQVFGAMDVVKYARRRDVQANIIVVGLPCGRGAQDGAATTAQILTQTANGAGSQEPIVSGRLARVDASAELLTSILTERAQDVSIVVACAGRLHPIDGCFACNFTISFLQGFREPRYTPSPTSRRSMLPRVSLISWRSEDLADLW